MSFVALSNPATKLLPEAGSTGYLKKGECKHLHWCCTGCSTDAVNNLKMLMTLGSRQEKMITEMVTLKSSVQELEINVNYYKK